MIFEDEATGVRISSKQRASLWLKIGLYCRSSRTIQRLFNPEKEVESI